VKINTFETATGQISEFVIAALQISKCFHFSTTQLFSAEKMAFSGFFSGPGPQPFPIRGPGWAPKKPCQDKKKQIPCPGSGHPVPVLLLAGETFYSGGLPSPWGKSRDDFASIFRGENVSFRDPVAFGGYTCIVLLSVPDDKYIYYWF